MDVMYYGDTLVVDLGSGTTETLEFSEVDDRGPGLAAGLALYKKYESDDPIVIGSGLLTGTPAPAACLGFVLGKSPLTGGPAVAPLNLFAGSEVKLSGFGAIVIKGKSKKPVYLWLHDGVADINDAAGLAGLDTWETTDALRREMGEQLVQVMSIGPAGEAGSKLAAFSVNYWGSGDTWALGALMGGKNLKALAVRGLGMLDAENPAEYYEAALSLLEKAPAPLGMGAVTGALGADDLDAWLKPMVHRWRSCFACPAACNAFVKYNEEASVVAPDGVDEPGFLVTGAAALLWLKGGGWDAENACRALEAMSRSGIDLVRGARQLADKPLDSAEAIAGAVKSQESAGEAGWPAGEAIEYGLFGAWAAPLKGQAEWEAAHRAGYVLGVCPVYLMLADGILDGLFDLTQSAAGIDLDQAAIDAMFS